MIQMKCAGYSSLVLFIYSIFHRSLEKTKASFRRIQSIWGQLLLIKWRKNNSDWWKIIFKLKKWKCDLVNFLAPFWYFDSLLPRYLQWKILLKCHILEDFFFFHLGELQEFREQMCVWVLAKKIIAKKEYSWWFEVVVVVLPSFICSLSKGHMWQCEF